MAAPATSAELASFTEDDALDSARGTLLLDQAWAVIRNHCRQTFELVTDDEVELRGTWSHRLKLPERPVVSVSSVEIGDTAITTYRLVRDTLVRTGPSDANFNLRGTTGRDWGGPSYTVTVTYTHGFASDTQAMGTLKGVCLQVAARAAGNPQSLNSFTTGAVGLGFGGGGTGAQVLGLTSSEQAILDRFRHEYAS